MLMGIIISVILKYFFGLGLYVVNFFVNFIELVFYYEILIFQFEVIKVDKMKDVVMIFVEVENMNEDCVLDVVVMV